MAKIKIDRIVVDGTNDVDYLSTNVDHMTLNGLGGADIMFSMTINSILNGGAGNDFLLGYQFNDVMNGGDNDDILFGQDGNDILNGDADQDQIYGGSGDDIVNGGSGNDILHARSQVEGIFNEGNDTITGGTGTDLFVFHFSSAAIGIATIQDFSSGTDHILFYNDTSGPLNFTENFVQGNKAVALDANDYIIYDTAHKALFYDADGSGAGAAVQFAKLIGIHELTAGDFAASF